MTPPARSSQRTAWRGAKAEVPARLNEGDVFLNTTSVDNTPVSVLEALACGLLTGDLFALDVGRTDPPSEGRLRVPLDRPGLGIDVAVP